MFHSPKKLPRSNGAAISAITPAPAVSRQPATRSNFRQVQLYLDTGTQTRTQGYRARRPERLQAPEEHEAGVGVRGHERQADAGQRERGHAADEHRPSSPAVGQRSPEHGSCGPG